MSETSKPATGRARARGRARGTQPTARRPEDQPVTVQAQAPAPVPVQPLEHRGRTAKRGVEHTTTTSDVELAKSMAAAAIGGTGNGKSGFGRGVHRGRPEHYEPKVVPSAGPSKQGEFGEVVNLAANYFTIDKLPQRSHNQYHVDFDPDIENVRMRKGMIYDHKDLFQGGYLFDGAALWAAAKLEQDVTEVYSMRKTDNEKIRITIKFIKEISARDSIMMQILSIQQRKNFTYLDFKEIDRQYYDISQTMRLDAQKMEFIPGFMTAIRQHEDGVLMNVELKFKFMRQESVLDMITNEFRASRDYFKQNCDKKLIGSIVMTNYNNKTYKVDEIDWDKSPRDGFKSRKGDVILYLDYMRTHYNLTVRDVNQPLLLSKPTARDIKRGDVTVRYLIPEFCVVTGLDDEKRADFTAMRELAKHTRVPPDGRVQKLLEFMRRMKTNEKVKEDMKKWGMDYSDHLVRIKGRNLGPETIHLNADPNDKGWAYDVKNADWSRALFNKRLLQPVAMNNWVIIHTQKDSSNAREFYETFRNVTRPMGLNAQPPRFCICSDDRTQTFSSVLRNEVQESTDMVVIIVPNNRKDRYDMIKKYCCVTVGVPSQVVVARTLMKKGALMSVVTKIAIQMNCKLGGQVWRVKIPLSNAMVVGIDSYHDSAQRNRSVCAVTCSMNQYWTTYFNQVSFQTAKQEMSDAFVHQLVEGLKNYAKLNKKLPARIFFYRDGVGDGQLAQVREWEIKQIDNAIASLGDPNYKPSYAFIVVNKRINTRFFRDIGNGRQWDNPLSGTVVDNVVTRPERYDFYLVSQSVREGTVGPTQYNVIFDSSNLKPDQMQRLTYKLTHLYYNWQGTIRVPAPCQYAHKLAFLVGQSLHTAPHERLANTLSFL